MNQGQSSKKPRTEGQPPLSVSLLAQEHHGAFMRFLRNRVGGASAEPADVAQEAYIRMLQYEGSEEIHSPYYMLLRVALNVVQDLRRAEQARRRYQHRPLEGLEIVSEAPGPESVAALAEELGRALAAIDALPPRCREVFLLHRRQHLSYTEISRLCGISVKTVEKHVSTALACCAERVWGPGREE
jgi:RNA polymerase sigma-70 factor (ECF subfamily)